MDNFIKYYLYDVYDYPGGSYIGAYNTTDAAADAARAYDAETDGECALVLTGRLLAGVERVVEGWRY